MPKCPCGLMTIQHDQLGLSRVSSLSIIPAPSTVNSTARGPAARSRTPTGVRHIRSSTASPSRAYSHRGAGASSLSSAELRAVDSRAVASRF